jgi:serine protease Do
MNRYIKLVLIATLVVLALVSAVIAGTRSRAWLGVSAQAVDRHIARDFDLKNVSGAIIDDVINRSPADKAGLKEDDIIIAFNDDKVRDDEDLTDLIQDSKPDDTVTLTLIRDGAEQKLKVELGRRSSYRGWTGGWNWSDEPTVTVVPSVPSVPNLPDFPDFYSGHGSYSYYSDDQPYIGVTLVELSRQAAQALGAKKCGVLVNEVERSSPADSAGVKAGDLIVAIDGESVSETVDVQEAIRDKDEGDTVSLTLVRDHKEMTLTVKVELDEESSYHGSRGSVWIPGLASSGLNWSHGNKKHYERTIQEYLQDSKEYESDLREWKNDMKELKKDLKETKKSLH